MILLNDEPLKIKQYPNGESRIEKEQFSQFLGNSIGRPAITLKYENDADLFQLLLVRKALWFPVELHIPYFPYSRMDRKSESHVFTLKSMAKYINWLDFDKVYIYEPHSDVTPALLNKCTIMSLIPQLLATTDFDKEKDFVLYPDVSAYKKYSDIIGSKNELIGIKKRDFKTGKITQMEIIQPTLQRQDITGYRIFIVDDLCSKGGTFVLAASKLRELGINEMYLVVGHCEKSIFDGDVFGHINKVFTTDTIIKKEYSQGNFSIESYLKIAHS